MNIGVRSKTLAMLIAAHALSVGMGLWLQDRFLLTTAHWYAARTAAADQSDPVVEGLSVNTILDALPGSQAVAFLWIVGLQSVITYLIFSRLTFEHQQKQQRSQEESLNRARDLVRTRDTVIFALAKLAESRDPDTGHHLERIALYSSRLAAAMRREPSFRNEISPNFVRTIGLSSALHDIGKVGVEDAVLLKPGKLNAEERFRMQVHTTLGGRCIQEIEKRLGNSNFLEMAREIAFCHHERWDGEGYPVGLKGNQIPLSARIVAVADVYDALSVRRVYKEPIPHEKCIEIIRAEAGRQFDPAVVDVFVQIAPQFRAIALRFSDETGACTDDVPPAPDTTSPLDESSLITADDERLILQTVRQDAENLRNLIESTE